MKIRRFWNSHGDTAARKQTGVERCDDVAYLLTALFDSEANEEEARRARLHLLACQRCAETFRGWNESRSILREASVPAPPPNMLWRVLRACRLASLSASDQTKAPAAQQSAGVPASLHASILAATIGQAKPPVRRRARPLWHPYSWSSLASPALALWLLFVNMGPSTLALIPRSQPASGLVTTTLPVASAVGRPEAAPAPVSPARPRVIRAPKAEEVPVADSQPEVSPARAEPPEVRHINRPVREETPVESARPAAVSEPAPAVPAAPEPATVRPAPVVEAAPVLRPASMADDEVDHPRAQRASFRPLAKAAIVRLAKSPGGLRVSTPDEPVSTPLVLASAGDTDNRLDEVQSTVQDFRALFASDGNTDDDNTADTTTAAG